MEGFTKREPLGGWKCDHCGADTHIPEEHQIGCLETQRALKEQAIIEAERAREALCRARIEARKSVSAEMDQLRTDFAHVSEMLEESVQREKAKVGRLWKALQEIAETNFDSEHSLACSCRQCWTWARASKELDEEG